MARNIIGFTGTHGTGKSTVLGKLRERLHPVDERSISRLTQEEFGWDAPEIAYSSVENMWRFQERILMKIAQRDLFDHAHALYVYVDRTPCEVWAYTAAWAQQLGIPEDNQRLKEYRRACVALANKYLGIVYFPVSADIPFVYEQGRSTVESREFVDLAILKLMHDLDSSVHTEVVESTDVAGRVVEIEEAKKDWMRNKLARAA